MVGKGKEGELPIRKAVARPADGLRRLGGCAHGYHTKQSDLDRNYCQRYLGAIKQEYSKTEEGRRIQRRVSIGLRT